MDEQQNAQTPNPDVEPPTTGSPNQSFTDVPTASANDFVAQQTQSPINQPEPSKKRRKLRVIAISIVAIVVTAGVGLTVFYFAFRMPDSEYDSLIRNLRSMREDAKIIPKETQAVDDTYNAANNKTRVDAAKSYVQKLEKVKSSKVLKNDTSVQAAYNSDKEVIEAYGQASLDLFETVAIHKKVTDACKSIADELAGITTVRAYDAKVLNCEKTMYENPHVPIKSFDESRHTKTIAAYKRIIELFRQAYAAYEAKDEAKLDSLESDIMGAYASYQEATSGNEVVSNTKNPTYILDDMIKTAEQRKSVFLRL